MRISDQQAQKRRGSRGQPYGYATRGPCGEVEVGRMGGGKQKACALCRSRLVGVEGVSWGGFGGARQALG